MKKFLAIMVVICMVIGMLPVVSFAEGNTITAVRTAYFNSNGNEWKSTDGDNLLVSVGATGWEGATSFTDTDGTVTTQASLSGTGFASARHSLVAFTLPEDLDTSKDMKVTLKMTVKNVKQVTSGARLSVYGNSVDGTWSTSSSTSIFGTFSQLPLLGLTDAILAGNQTGEAASNEIITLSSLALTNYVKQMAEEGKSEVTFRLACTLGGIRIYDTNTASAPTLTIEVGELSEAVVKTVFYDGDEVVDTEEKTVGNLFVGDTYTYPTTPQGTIVKGTDVYVYSQEMSTLSVTVNAEGDAEIILCYVKDEDTTSFYGYEYEDEGAWCWFADPRAVTLKNEEGTIDVTVIGYIDVHGNIKATQIDNLTDKVQEVLIRTNIQPDDHNNPTFIMIPDGRIVVFYSRHTDEACFWYRVTEEPGDLTTLGEEKCLVTANNTTYPSPFFLSDDPEHIYLCWRGIEWHPTIAKLSLPDENGDMEFTYGPYQMVRSSGVGSNVRPYAKYASNGKDKIFMSYTGTHPDNYNPNWLYFNYIDITTMTMHDINGTLMRTIENGPLIVDHSNQSHIVDKTSNVRNWLWQVALDEDENPIIANVRIDNSKTSHDYYYVKWNGTEWVKTFLTNAGGKFHPSNTEYCYSGGMSIDVDNPNVIYVSKPVDGLFGKVWEIFKYTMSDDGKTIVSTEQITENSPKNNVRPWVIPGSAGKDLRVMWMHGDYDFWMVNSVYPNGYPTAIMGEVEPPKEDVDLDDNYIFENYEDIGGVFLSTKNTANTLYLGGIVGSGVRFSVSVDAYLAGDYTGTIIDSETVTLSVKNMTTRYADNDETSRPRLVLTVDGVDYVSPNVYGTSDEWKNHNIRTGGEYFFTKYDGYVNLTIVSDGKYITVYRDGLVDINAKVKTDKFEYIKVGGFDGYVENAVVFHRAINHDEIKALADIDYAIENYEIEAEDSVTVKYFAYGGENVTTKEIKPSETVLIYPGTDVYIVNAQKSFVKDGFVYTLVKESYSSNTKNASAIYKKHSAVGENLVPDGSFEDEDGNFSWGTWQTPGAYQGSSNFYYKDNCGDWFYKVNRDTNQSVLYTNSLTADDYALGTRWNDGSTGTCSLANFIPVEAGKTYYVAYDYKHASGGVDTSYISTAFVTEKDYVLNASGNNIPMNVTTDWQTNEFAITAEEDGYIYFHFSWLGNSNNAGNGPYWFFDNFKVIEAEPEKIYARNLYVNKYNAVFAIYNLIDEDVTDVNVYAVGYNDDGVVAASQMKTIDVIVDSDLDYTTVSFDNLGTDVELFCWDENMKPLCDAVEATSVNENIDDPDAHVMVVSKVAYTSVNEQTTYKITGIKEGATIAINVDPAEYEATQVEKGNVIMYETVDSLASNVQVLFASCDTFPADSVEEGFENIYANEFSDENATIHYGEITSVSTSGFCLNDDKEFCYSDDYSITVVDYTGNTVSIKTGSKTSVKASYSKYKRTAFVKTVSDMEDEVRDVVVFIENAQ